ncbi:unnamed protein product, partial [Mesorhabditis belari]|uniref:FBA domain-containing protein n=1 Tax=Mesorhabditis belari TaxID=2138241 RepID=A0AAF3EJS7_9BILA
MDENDSWKDRCVEKGLTLPPKEVLEYMHEQGHAFDFAHLFEHTDKQKIDPYGNNLLLHLPLKPNEAKDFAIRKTWLMYEGNSCTHESPIVGYDVKGESDDPIECLSTSCQWGYRKLEIDLEKCGIEPWILDNLKPIIVIEEKHAPRNDCGAMYRFSAKLLAYGTDHSTHSGSEVEIEREYRQWAGEPWTREEMRLICKRGHRRLILCSEGKDTRDWAGNYGMKFTDTKVRIEFLEKLPEVKEMVTKKEKNSKHRKHRDHRKQEADDKEKVKFAKNESQSNSTNPFENYQQICSQFHLEINEKIRRLKKKLKKSTKNGIGGEEAMEKREEAEKKFEEISEMYLPYLRIYATELEQLLDETNG